MTDTHTRNEFENLAYIEEIARLALADMRDDDTAWAGLTVSWSKP